MTPACPRCDNVADVERSRTDAAPYWCAGCNLAFTGSPDEWAAEHERRVRRCSPVPDFPRSSDDAREER